MILRAFTTRLPLTGTGLVFGALLGAIATVIALNQWISQPPVRVLSIRELDGAAQQNGVLEVAYKAYRSSDCERRVTYWLWHWMGDPNVNRAQYAVPLGTSMSTFLQPSPLVQSLVLALPLPRSVTPGKWFLRVRTADYCTLLSYVLGPRIQVIDNVPLAVVPAATPPSSEPSGTPPT